MTAQNATHDTAHAPLLGVLKNGYCVVDRKIIESVELSVEAKALYLLYLAFYDRKKKKSLRVTERTLLKFANISHPTFLKHRKMLVERGVLKISHARHRLEKSARIVYDCCVFDICDSISSGEKACSDFAGEDSARQSAFGLVPLSVLLDTGLSLCAKAFYATLCVVGRAPFYADSHIDVSCDYIKLNLMSVARMRKAVLSLKESGYLNFSQERSEHFTFNRYVLQHERFSSTKIFSLRAILPMPKSCAAQNLTSQNLTNNNNTELYNKLRSVFMDKTAFVKADTATTDNRTSQSSKNDIIHRTHSIPEKSDSQRHYSYLHKLIKGIESSQVQSYTVNSEKIIADELKRAILLLSDEDIYCISKKLALRTDIKNMRAYSIACLYNRACETKDPMLFSQNVSATVNHACKNSSACGSLNVNRRAKYDNTVSSATSATFLSESAGINAAEIVLAQKNRCHSRCAENDKQLSENKDLPSSVGAVFGAEKRDTMRGAFVRSVMSEKPFAQRKYDESFFEKLSISL